MKAINTHIVKKEVLIVEDEQDCAELLRYHLQRENYQTVIARDGEEAIEVVQCRTPDVVLLDIMLPKLDGWEVCRILRESTKGKSLPIIMLTALSDEEARVKGLSLGADDYVSKPYSLKELMLKVRRHVEREETIKQLRVREQEKDTALRYVVHELRNTLTAIGGFSSLALKKNHPDKYLKTINNAVDHGESLLNDASLLSRLEEGREGLATTRVDIMSVIEEATDLIDDKTKQPNIEMIILNRTTLTVKGDRTAIRQIMINLISNAVKYNRPGGKVRIWSNERIDSVEISIQDEGCGIAKDDISRIFDKFYRAAGSELIKGAGLGLYIVRLLLDAMRGGIVVKSQQGEGSTFTVSLPKAETMDDEKQIKAK